MGNYVLNRSGDAYLIYHQGRSIDTLKCLRSTKQWSCIIYVTFIPAWTEPKVLNVSIIMAYRQLKYASNRLHWYDIWLWSMEICRNTALYIYFITGIFLGQIQCCIMSNFNKKICIISWLTDTKFIYICISNSSLTLIANIGTDIYE